MSEHQELVDRFLEVVDILIKFERQITEIDETIARLQAEGMTSATVHWRRKDVPGKPDMLELVHRSGSDYERDNRRRREYIGTDPGQIKAALARCKRFRQMKDLQGERARLKKQASNIEWAIKNVFRVSGKKQELWGQSIDAGSNQVSPGAGGDNAPGQNCQAVPNRNGDNGDWGQAELLQQGQVPTQAKVDVSPRGFVPKDMAEVKAYFEQSPELASIANDIGKAR